MQVPVVLVHVVGTYKELPENLLSVFYLYQLEYYTRAVLSEIEYLTVNLHFIKGSTMATLSRTFQVYRRFMI